MLITDKIVFIELQKTGSTHIKKLLKDILGGKNDGKHNVPTEELLASGKPFMGSIRDPWGWYLSLWSYGCQQQGELYQRMTNEKRWEKLLTKLDAARKARADKGEATEKPEKKSILPEQMGAERAKTYWYADASDAAAFREWLRVICSLQTRRVVEAGFAQSPIGKVGGLMTFRYFNLFVRGADKIPATISTQEGLRAFEAEHLVLKHIIRQDSLAEDLVMALDRSGVALTDEQRKKIYDAKPTNKSARPHGFEHYFDLPSVDLVARREKFIVDKFGYQRPHV
jgi:hypothetical protein